MWSQSGSVVVINSARTNRGARVPIVRSLIALLPKGYIHDARPCRNGDFGREVAEDAHDGLEGPDYTVHQSVPLGAWQPASIRRAA